MNSEHMTGHSMSSVIDALVPEHVRNFEAYIPSKPDHHLMLEYGAPFLYRLNNNENSLGPPPAAQRHFPP